MVQATCAVRQGKLQVQYLAEEAGATTLARLANLYGDERMARAFTNRVLQKINDELNALNPIAEWKAATGAGRGVIDVTNLVSAPNLAQSKDFSGSLTEWLTRFLVDTNDAGTFFQWRPTSPPDPEENPPKPVVEDELSALLSALGSVLIARIGQSEVAAMDYRKPVFRLMFNEAAPVAKVRIVGMDVPEKLGREEGDKFSDYHHQKERFEAELCAAATGLALAWNDDLAVQRMMIVLRARGMWNGFAQAEKGSPRAVHWLTFATNAQAEVEAEVHLPHLCHLVFGPGATDDSVILAVAAALLGPEERAVLTNSIAVQTSQAGSDQFLRRIVSPMRQELDGGRYVDLFAMASYRGFKQTGTNGVRYPPNPVKESWLAPRLEKIKDLGWRVSAEPTGILKGENRLRNSSNKERWRNEHGGIDVWVSPRNTNDLARRGGTVTNDASFKNWLLHTVKYRVEAGVKIQDTQPPDWFARFSAAHTDGGSTCSNRAFGSLSAELRYQYRLSASLDWQPPESEESLLPSNLTAFTDSAARRKVDGQDTEVQRNGFRAGKRSNFGFLDWKPRWSAGLELAEVHDFAGYVPDGNEFSAPLTVSLFSEPNLWDAREYWNLGLSATPSVRWQSNSDFWTLVGAVGQVRRPYGRWDYFGSFDVQWAAGSAPPDALPYVGGVEGVRGVRPYGAPAEVRLVLRNEIWSMAPFIERQVGSDQRWYRLAYERLRLAGFVDLGWASGIREGVPTDPWFVSPGVGLRLMLTPSAHISLDYAYGICSPSDLGGHRFSLGIRIPFD